MSLSFDWADGLRSPAPKCKATIFERFVREGHTFFFELARRAPRWTALGQVRLPSTTGIVLTTGGFAPTKLKYLNAFFKSGPLVSTGSYIFKVLNLPTRPRWPKLAKATKSTKPEIQQMSREVLGHNS